MFCSLAGEGGDCAAAMKGGYGDGNEGLWRRCFCRINEEREEECRSVDNICTVQIIMSNRIVRRVN